MRELQLVGYTADLLHLVFTDTAEGGARFKAAIDEDFVATLTEVLELVDPDSVPLGALAAGLGGPGAQTPAEGGGQADGDEDAEERGYDERSAEEPEPTGPGRGEGPLAGMAAAQRPITSDDGEAQATVERSRPSKLAPREIQALLRAGQGPRSVAKQADTDEQWVRRWLPPIEAERDQVLQAVWSSFVAKARLGVSAEPVGEAVERNLAAKGVHEDDPSVEWIVSRREGDTHWRVVLRYRSRGRAQRALWNFNLETGELDPRNDLAVEIAWVRPNRAALPDETRSSGRRAPRSSSRGKRGGKKGARKKKSPSKKSAAKKGPGKKAPAKKSASKKSAAKKASEKKPAAKKSSAEQPPAEKRAAKKSAAGKATAKKAAAKKSAAGKTTAKKSPAKKSATKTSATKTSATKKTATKKTATKKASAPPGPPPQ